MVDVNDIIFLGFSESFFGLLNVYYLGKFL